MVNFNKLPSWLYLVSFLLLAVSLRVLSFQFSVIDHDEATYLVIAQEFLNGKAYYTDVWDTKPIGIFYIFAAVLKVFGNSVMIVRLFAALVIGFTGYLLFLSARRWGQSLAAAAIAGLVYPLLCSLHKWTFSANSEIFFNLFTAAGLYFFLGKKNALNFFLAGLAVGLGFMIKYFVLFDLAAFWLFYVFVLQKNTPRSQLAPLVKQTAAMGLGFILPFAFTFAYYFFLGPFDDFWFNTFELPGKYANGFQPLRMLGFFTEFQLIYLPFVLAFYALIFWGKDRNLAIFAGLWTALVWVVMILPGKFFLHYYFQLLLPLCFMLTALPGSGTRLEQLLIRYRVRVLPLLACVLFSWNVYLQYQSFVIKPDRPKEAAEYLKSRMSENDVLYCNQSNILYFLLEKSPPSRYVHPTLLTKEEHIEAIGVNVQHEMRKILGQKPKYFVLENEVEPLIEAYVNQNCRLVKTIGESILIYELK